MSHDTAAKSSTSGTVVQFVPYGTKFEQIDPASLSATLTLSMLVHRFWGPATGLDVTRTADGRIRYVDASYANDNRAKFIRGLNGGGPVWIGVEAPADGAEKPKSKPQRGRVPYIELRDGNLPNIVDQAEQALIAAELGVYQRGGRLVRAAMVPIKIADGEKMTALRFIEITEPTLREQLGRAIQWRKFDARSRRSLPRDVPDAVSRILLARGTWRLPLVTGLVSTPVLRPNGTVLTTPGYDAETGLLFDPQGLTFPPVPDRPTVENAREALAKLEELLSGFAFVNETDRAVALSMLLSGFARHAVDATPGHGVTAPAAGSGKSYLVDVTSMLLTGKPCGVISQGLTQEEFEKQLDGELLGGAQMTNIDNCTRPLDGAKLCQILTQPMVKFRILGKTGNPEVTNTLFVAATGNNLQIVGDATRRFMLCRQDAKTERPDLRTFTFDALEKARAHRGEFVQAALTVLRAAHVAGDAVPHGRPLAGFSGWCRVVRDALCWLGEADPLTSIETIREQDATLQTHAAVLQFWHEGLGEQPISAQGLIDYATERLSMADADIINRPLSASRVSNFLHPELREALMGVAGDKGFIDLKRLGYWLRAKHGKPVEGLKIVKATTVRGMHQWKVVEEG